MGKFITNSWANSNTWANLLQIHVQIQIRGQIHANAWANSIYMGILKCMGNLSCMIKKLTEFSNSNTWANLLQIHGRTQIHG